MPPTADTSDAPGCGQLRDARLPAWCLPHDWPRPGGQVASAQIVWREGVIEAITPEPAATAIGTTALVLPALVQAHAHLDKAYTVHRAVARGPGLLAAIEAVIGDRAHWSAPDLQARMAQGLQDAWDAGVTVLRTHIDWIDGQAPLAWHIAGELAQAWSDRVRLERVALVPLRFFADKAMAHAIAARVAASGTGSVMGGFVHTSNWDRDALAHLVQAAQAHDLDLDLHVDEELNPQAEGVATVVRLAAELKFDGVITCSHACALAAQPGDQALATLDAMARLPQVRMVSLPTTNLLLQDARTGATPRQRGITLVHEARARGIPVLIGSDNVRDPFCHGGTLDPLEAFLVATYAAQLADPFDTWSAAICRPDWLSRAASARPLARGAPADLICFAPQPPQAWPGLPANRRILQHGEWRAPHQRAPEAQTTTDRNP